jgi:hypothetical protein
MHRLQKRALGAALALWLAAPAAAAPPANADPRFTAWFESLMSPHGGHCCGPEVDCRPVAYRMKDDHYEALLDVAIHEQAKLIVDEPTWIEIPAESILERHDNPLGVAVMCWHYFHTGQSLSDGVLCFIRPAET